jgi:hypothetical protein
MIATPYGDDGPIGPELSGLMVSWHHQLTTDADLDEVTAPHKYRAIARQIALALMLRSSRADVRVQMGDWLERDGDG